MTARPYRYRAAVFFGGGGIALLVLLVGGFLLFLKLGYFPLEADAGGSELEAKIVRLAISNALDRLAPKQDNPVADSDATVLEGMKLYKSNCSECHGRMRADSMFGQSMYPPAPQFTEETTPLTESQIFFIARHGIRMTGMPAFSKMLSDEEIWKIARFVKRMHALPPSVNDLWQHPTE